ncbi:MAG: ribulose-phosphate 3-epimerase [Anaerolineales bacterium]|nr:ribulose-phosphate 3-epimerase [Anaerolineales bacterium]MCK5635208.1 ribulose-phosphate 3-epimerase [Anaerolineales bacterium]
MMVKNYVIMPSILSADFLNLGDAIAECVAAGVDWLHLDIMDGHFVPNIALGPGFVEACRRATDLPLDVHLMIENPDRYLDAFTAAGASSITVHYEVCPRLPDTISKIRNLGIKAGIALSPDTAVDEIKDVLDLVDVVLVMTVQPGFAGQSFIESSIEKIRRMRSLIDAAGLETHLQVDGGINHKTAPECAEAGADFFVAASAIFQHPNGITAGIHALQSSFEMGAA